MILLIDRREQMTPEQTIEMLRDELKVKDALLGEVYEQVGTMAHMYHAKCIRTLETELIRVEAKCQKMTENWERARAAFADNEKTIKLLEGRIDELVRTSRATLAADHDVPATNGAIPQQQMSPPSEGQENQEF